MSSNRVEAFSDGVLAIIITIMVLALPVPKGPTFGALAETGLPILTYLISFIYVGIYWNNHHHLFQAATKVTGNVLWANLATLFMISLIPFTTGWMNDSGLARDPVSLYGLNLLGAAVMFLWLERALVSCHGPDSPIARAVTGSWKEKASLALYIVGALLPFSDGILPGRLGSIAAIICYVAVALIWLIPDRRLERHFA